MIAVLDYGIGNLRSAVRAFDRIGAPARLVSDPDDVAVADRVVLPGVGAFGPCVRALHQTGLAAAVRAAVSRSVPFLGICVGFQVLFEGSEEDPSVPGLGLLPGRVRRLPDGVKHPQMQWNRLDIVEPASPMFSGLPAGPWVYFVHSFAPEQTSATAATCAYGGPVVAAATRGNLWGTQFHPEKSGPTGLALLANFARLEAGPAQREKGDLPVAQR